MGSTTPPWRSLDAPTTSTPSSEGPAVAPTSPRPPGPNVDGIPARLVATVAAAVVCALVAIVVATSGGSGAEVVVDGAGRLPDASGSIASDAAVAGGSLVVEAVGAVRRPGVYRLPAGSRVGDLVAAAGGYGPRVDTDRAERELNLAAQVRDGEQIRVPSRDDPAVAALPAGSGPATGAGAAGDGAIDLNQATAAELDALPGIGPVTIEKILAAREEAPFTSVDDLRTRGLVGEQTFGRIRASLVVR